MEKHEPNPIAHWFKTGKDYDSGVLLLRRFGLNTTRYDPYLNRVPPNFLSFQLQTALESCVALLPTLKTPMLSAVPQTPDVVLQWRADARKWHKLESDNHSRLHFATTKEERVPIVIERMTIIAPALDELYRKIRLYEKTGQLDMPIVVENNPQPIDIQSINAWWVEKANVESRLSRIRKQEKYRTEIQAKFARLYDIYMALQMTFEKQLSDYLP